MIRRPARNDEATSIDISPLIDMVFILLIFFMVSSTFVKDVKVDIERPRAKTASAANTRSVRVHLDQRGNVYVDGQPTRPWLVESVVREQLRTADSSDVLVIADRRTPTEKLVYTVDACRAGGAGHVGVATDGAQP